MKYPFHTRTFTLIELLVTISIIAILSSILMPAISSAQLSGTRTELNGKVKAIIHLADFRIMGNRIADWTFQTLPPSYSDNLSFAFFVGPDASPGSLNDGDNWLAIDPNEYNSTKDLADFDTTHLFNEDEGHFIFCSSIYAPEIHEFTTLRKIWMSETRKIAFDVYDYENEGDGKVSVGYADGHVETEETELKGLPDTKATLIGTAVHSYTPGVLKADL